MKKLFLFLLILCLLGSCNEAYTQTVTDVQPAPSIVATILFNIFVVLSVAFVIVLVYSLRSNKSEFDFMCWIKMNYFRFILGSILGIIISILVVVSPDADAIFTIIGFNASHTPVSIGLALGAFLVAGVSGSKPDSK